MDGLVNASFCPSPFNVNIGSAPLALMAKKVGLFSFQHTTPKAYQFHWYSPSGRSGVVAWKKIDW